MSQQNWGQPPPGQPFQGGPRPPGGFQPSAGPQPQQQPGYGPGIPSQRPLGPAGPGYGSAQPAGLNGPTAAPRPVAHGTGPPGGAAPAMRPPGGPAAPYGQQAPVYSANGMPPQGPPMAPRPMGGPAPAYGAPPARPAAHTPAPLGPRPPQGPQYGAPPAAQVPMQPQQPPRPTGPAPGGFGAQLPPGGPRPVSPAPGVPGMRPPGQAMMQPGAPGMQQQQQQQQQQQSYGAPRPPGGAVAGGAGPLPPGMAALQAAGPSAAAGAPGQGAPGFGPGFAAPQASFGAPPQRPVAAFGAPQTMGGFGAPHGLPGGFAAPPPQGPPSGYGAPPPQGPPPPGFGAPPPAGLGMRPMLGGGIPGVGAPPPPGMGSYDPSTMSAALDAFETLSLGAAGPGMPGAPSAPAADPAAFPRPAGTAQQQEAALGPPPPFSSGNCAPAYMRLTTQAAPSSQALKARWHLPYGCVVHPLADCDDAPQVPTANPRNEMIVRCKRCRTYINPFMQFMDQGRRFSCNICQMMNETPQEYYCQLDAGGRRLDAAQRPELCCGSVEYVAPAEYMVRAPMPPTYVFVIDVSNTAAASGMLAASCAAIKAALDSIPGEGRTRLAFLTFDSTLHFYALRPGAAAPQMLVVAEIEEPFVPAPDELLVNLVEGRAAIEQLLDSIPASFGRNQVVESCPGAALEAAFLVMNHTGGKLMLFQSSPPSLGQGKIKPRDNPALYGTDREHALRGPDDPFYKKFAAEASRFQVCVDVFAGGPVHMDLPSLGALSRYTGGQCYYYPGFSAASHSPKLAAEVRRNLSRETGWEAVMRIRCSKGLKITAFHGHFFVRSTDLLALPCTDADKTFTIEMGHEETVLTGSTAYIQSALLYTSSQGERRIRVHTLAMPVVSELLDLYKASDAGATAAVLAKSSVERSMSSKLEDVRIGVQQRVAAALREYRMLHVRAVPGGGPPPSALVLPERLRSLPVLALGLVKTAALRGGGRDVNTDERAAVALMVAAGSVRDLLRLMYPLCFRVDDPSGEWGKVDRATGSVVLPATTPAGLEYFDPKGAYLLDNGRLAILWVGTATPRSFYDAAFGPSPTSQDASALALATGEGADELATRIAAVLQQLRARREAHQSLYVVRQGSPVEAHVLPYFVEDSRGAAGPVPGYLDWMLTLQKMVMAKQ